MMSKSTKQYTLHTHINTPRLDAYWLPHTFLHTATGCQELSFSSKTDPEVRDCSRRLYLCGFHAVVTLPWLLGQPEPNVFQIRILMTRPFMNQFDFLFVNILYKVKNWYILTIYIITCFVFIPLHLILVFVPFRKGKIPH